MANIDDGNDVVNKEQDVVAASGGIVVVLIAIDIMYFE